MAINTGVIPGYNSVNITAQTTTVAKTGTGILHAVTFNKPTATAVVTIYDGVDTNGTKIATITVPASPMPVTLFYDRAVTTGITITTGTADSDITVIYV